MKTVKGKGFCPRCYRLVTLVKYGAYLSREFKLYEPIFEGWCPNCRDHVELNLVFKTVWRKDNVTVR